MCLCYSEVLLLEHVSVVSHFIYTRLDQVAGLLGVRLVLMWQTTFRSSMKVLGGPRKGKPELMERFHSTK